MAIDPAYIAAHRAAHNDMAEAFKAGRITDIQYRAWLSQQGFLPDEINREVEFARGGAHTPNPDEVAAAIIGRMLKRADENVLECMRELATVKEPNARLNALYAETAVIEAARNALIICCASLTAGADADDLLFIALLVIRHEPGKPFEWARTAALFSSMTGKSPSSAIVRASMGALK